MEKYVQPFIETTTQVFKNFVQLDVTAATPYFVESVEEKEWSISGIIGLTGEASGAVVLSLHDDLAIQLAKILTGEDVSINDDAVLADVVGEIINIIAGNVKKLLEESYRLVISLPTIVKGQGHKTLWPNQAAARAVRIPFTSGGENLFAITVALKA